MLNQYDTIIEKNIFQLVEKKSKFICNLIHVESEKEAKEAIEKIKKENYNARHNAFAYIVLDDNNIIEKFSDDGEPSGTAGKPLLDILKQKKVVNVLFVVTRYFGGILLGTGGLVRAYSGSALECFKLGKIVTMINSSKVEIKLKYDEIDIVRYYCESNCYILDKIEYLENIIAHIIVDNTKIDKFSEDIQKILNRNADISVIEKIFVKK